MISEDTNSPVAFKEVSDDRKNVAVLQVDAKSADSADVANESEKADGEKPAVKSEYDIDDDVALTFPQSLMEILDDEANSEVVSWLPHGRGFIVYRKKAFEKKILPKYFSKQSKYSSFTRKLNRWGFVRVTRGPETGAYYHQFFKRGEPRLCMQMSCKNSHGSKSAAAMKVHPPALLNPSLALYGGLPVPAADAGMSLGLESLQYQQPLAQLQLLQQQLAEQELLRRAIQERSQLYPDVYAPIAANQNISEGDSSILAQLAQIRQAAAANQNISEGDSSIFAQLAQIRPAARGGGVAGLSFPDAQSSLFK